MTDLTVSEVVRVLNAVEPQLQVSERRVRYAIEVQSLDPAHASLGPGDAWRFSIYDVAVLRLLFQVQQRTSARIAWGVFTYFRDELLAEFKALRLPTVLALDGPKPFLVSPKDAKTLGPHIERFPLMEAFRGLGEAVREELKARQEEQRRVPMWGSAAVTEARA